ncbi:MAG: peptidylprolyl isomerase [Chloroflexales bacterium]|nr:peptidylprolyl isomerase [Chloroflexales bacterium]
MRCRVWIGVLMCALALTACKSTDNGANLEATDSPITFRVGTTTVTIQDFQDRMEREIGAALQQSLAQGQTEEEIIQLVDQQDVRRAIFETMIQEALLLQIARQEGIGVDPKEIDANIDRQQGFGALDDRTESADDRLEQRVGVAREQLVFAVIARKTLADMVKARHILVADEATADQIITDLNNGTSFAELASEFSTDPGSQNNGGELGWTPRGNFVPEFEEAAFSADLNTPIKVGSQFGWHVIEVQDRQSDRPFDDFNQLQGSQNGQQFFEDTFLPWYEGLRETAEANGDLEISPNFDPNSVPLPFRTTNP